MNGNGLFFHWLTTERFGK